MKRCKAELWIGRHRVQCERTHTGWFTEANHAAPMEFLRRKRTTVVYWTGDDRPAASRAKPKKKARAGL